MMPPLPAPGSGITLACSATLPTMALPPSPTATFCTVTLGCPRGCGGLGLTGCGYGRCLVEVWNWIHVDVSSARASEARAVRQRAGDH